MLHLIESISSCTKLKELGSVTKSLMLELDVDGVFSYCMVPLILQSFRSVCSGGHYFYDFNKKIIGCAICGRCWGTPTVWDINALSI